MGFWERLNGSVDFGFKIYTTQSDKKPVFDDNWIYIHDEDIKAGRIQNYTSWSNFMAPKNKGCLGLEYFCNEGENFWNKKDDGEYIRSRKQYLTQDNQNIVFIKGNGTDSCSKIGYLNTSDNDIRNIDCIPLETIKNPYVHPMDIFSKTEYDYHILGTISDGDGRIGVDRLSILSEAIFRTASFSILSKIEIASAT